MSRRTVGGLVAVVLALLGVERGLAWQQARRGLGADQRQSLLRRDEVDFLATVSRVELSGPDATIRAESTPKGWLCPSLNGAPIDTRVLRELFEILTVAEGRVLRTEGLEAGAGSSPATADSLASDLFGPADQAWSLRLSSSWRDPIELSIGRRVPQSDLCYVRRGGQIMRLDRDLGRVFGSRGLLGILDPRLITQSWPTAGARIVAVEVARPGSQYRLELVVHPGPARAETSPAHAPSTAPSPFSWRLVGGGEPVRQDRAQPYLRHLQLATWQALSPLRTDPPGVFTGSVEMIASDGSRCRLRTLALDQQAHVVNERTGQRFVVPLAEVQRLAPPRELLCSDETPSPWPDPPAFPPGPPGTFRDD